jgi:hypothetical protein
MDVVIGDQRYRIESKGFLFNRQVVMRNQAHEEVARVSTGIPILGLFRNWKATLSSGSEYQWKEKGFLNRKWQWNQSDTPVVSSEERNGLFNINGEIQLATNLKDAELLTHVGLYLRSSYG